jgi:hypothetical protein
MAVQIERGHKLADLAERYQVRINLTFSVYRAPFECVCHASRLAL